VLIDDTSAALSTLRDLKALGIGLELDDFGMGYSSLSYLHRFPFDALKLDRSFVNCLTEEEDSAAIARTVIALGDALKMEVLAEGIETVEQVQRLASMGCLYGQGYFFSRPLAPDQCVRLAASPEHPRKGLVLMPPSASGRNGRRLPQPAETSQQAAVFLPTP
jgi:EAL domain-containing protein (putative c-di-GMP-specific phosphodiesterase class I)